MKILIFFLCIILLTRAHHVSWFNLTIEQFNDLSLDEFTHLNAEDLGSISNEIIQLFTEPIVGIILPSSWSGLLATQMESLSEESCGGFSRASVSSFPVSAMSGISAGCISNMQPRAIARLTADHMRNIVPEACEGFSNLHAFEIQQAALGFTAEHISKFTSDDFTSGCAGMRNTFLEYLPKESYPGFTADCISVMEVNSFNSLTPEELSLIPPLSMSGFSLMQISLIPPGAFVSLTEEQFRNLRPGDLGGCRGLNRDIITQIPDTSFRGWEAFCVQTTPSAAFGGLTVSKIANIEVDTILYFSRIQFSMIPAQAVSGLSAEQISNLSFSDENSACSGINAPHLSNFIDNSISGLSSACIERMPAHAFTGLRATQLPYLADDAIRGFQEEDLRSLRPEILVAFTAKQVGLFRGVSCAGLDEVRLSLFSPEAFAGFLGGCLSHIPAESWRSVSAEQFSMISVYTELMMHQIAEVPPQAFTKLSVADVSTFGRLCGGLNKFQISNISAESFPGVTSLCLSSILHFNLALTREQLGNISTTAISGLTEVQLSSLDPTIMGGLSEEQVRNFNQAERTNVCHGFTRFMIPYLSETITQGFSAHCVFSIRASFAESLTIYHIQNLPATSFSGFSPFHLRRMPTSLVRHISLPQLRNMANSAAGFNEDVLVEFSTRYGEEFITLFSPLDFVGMFKEIMHNFKNYFNEGVLFPLFSEPPRPFELLNWMGIAFMKDDFDFESQYNAATGFFQNNIAGLRAPHVKRLSTNFFRTLQDHSFGYFTPDMIVVLSSEQVQAITPSMFGSIDRTYIKALPAALIPILSTEQLNSLSFMHIEELTCEQIYSLTDAQKNTIKDDLLIVIEQRRRDCQNENFPTRPTIAPTQITETTSSTSPDTEGSGAVVVDEGSRITFMVFASIIAGLLLVVIIVIITSFCIKRPSSGGFMRR